MAKESLIIKNKDEDSQSNNDDQDSYMEEWSDSYDKSKKRLKTLQLLFLNALGAVLGVITLFTAALIFAKMLPFATIAWGAAFPVIAGGLIVPLGIGLLVGMSAAFAKLLGVNYPLPATFARGILYGALIGAASLLAPILLPTMPFVLPIATTLLVVVVLPIVERVVQAAWNFVRGACKDDEYFPDLDHFSSVSDEKDFDVELKPGLLQSAWNAIKGFFSRQSEEDMVFYYSSSEEDDASTEKTNNNSQSMPINPPVISQPPKDKKTPDVQKETSSTSYSYQSPGVSYNNSSSD